MITLSDFYIGNFPETQGFGENPANYAQFNLKGHNGIDIGTPNGTLVISPFKGTVTEIGSDPKGYGNYCKVYDKDQLCVCLIGHMQQVAVSQGQSIVKGQLLGYSNNTGNSTGPHIHFGVYKTDASGVRLNSDNGYNGYVNPNDGRIFTWDIKNPTEPVKPTSDSGTMTIEKKVFEELVAKCTEYDNAKQEHLQTLGKLGELQKQYDQLQTNYNNLQDTTDKTIQIVNQQLETTTANLKITEDERDALKEVLAKDDSEKQQEINKMNITIAGLNKKISDLELLLKDQKKYRVLFTSKRLNVALIQYL